MQIDIHKAYQEWAKGTAGAYNSEDAYYAGYAMAMRVKDEEQRREEHPVVKNLKALSALLSSVS